jgi:predicted nucleotidyltransferase component of viral defense system
LGIEIEARLARLEAMNQIYLDTARLMTQIAPFVFADGIFALKGGTAINLFLRDMPRLSVDLDLVFVNHRPSRDDALASINAAIRAAVDRLEASGFRTYVTTTVDVGETKLFVRRGNIEVKVEANFVTRGTVHPVQTASLTSKAKEALLADLELPILSLEDVYGGKLVAAMDRQHPRDLFDVLQLFAHEGITPGIRRSFVVYLASHNRPIHEVLFPTQKDITQEYEQTFRGMTTEQVELAELLSTRERLIAELQRSLNSQERQFLISLAYADPDWSLLEIEHLELLPGIRWKLQNLRKLAKNNPTKLRSQADELAQRLMLSNFPKKAT